MEAQKKFRLYIILGFIVVSLAIIGIVTAIYSATTAPEAIDTPEQNEYVDPGSGETVLDPEGKVPENYGTNPNQPVVLGLSYLYDRGFSQEDIENVKAAFNDYANQRVENNEEKINEISLNTSSVEHRVNRETGLDTYTAKLVINRKDDYMMKVSLNSLDETTIGIYKGSSVSGVPEFSVTKDS